jgi:hypothetical protein
LDNPQYRDDLAPPSLLLLSHASFHSSPSFGVARTNVIASPQISHGGSPTSSEFSDMTVLGTLFKLSCEGLPSLSDGLPNFS